MTDYSERLRALTAEPSRDLAGDPHRLARVARTRSEMMAQGSAISTTLAAGADTIVQVARMLRARPIQRVVVAGCGDSWHAGAGVALAWESMAGTPLRAVQALDYACYGAAVADAQTLVVGISSGGSTPAVLAALRAARRRGAFTLGISNTVASQVLTESDAAVLVHASRTGWPTQSSTATMALLIRLAQEFANNSHARDLGAELDTIPALVDALAPALDAQMATIAAEVAAARLLLFAGLGPNCAAAAFGAAKIKELSPIHALVMPLEEYHHYRSQKAGDPLLLVATDPASHERALDTALVGQARGGWTVAVLAQDLPEITSRVQHTVTVPYVRPELAALVSTIPLHLFAYHFAQARDALGLGYPGAFPTP
jgi:glucosamine--fructose-6-phosphate aminotransferase (isomerizing)